MKNNKRLLVLIGLMVMVLVTLQVSGQTKKLRDIGRYKFLPMDAGRPAPEMMKVFAEKYADDVRRGFEVAGAPQLYPQFMEQLRQGAVTERALPVGTTMVWMIFRSQGQIKAVHDLEWAGREPLPVMAISVQEGNEKYEIVVPKACGNVALERVESVPAPAGEAEPAPEPAPQPPFQQKQDDRYQISKGKIYQEITDLINQTDLYCSYSVWEKEIPELQIIGAEREDDKIMFSDGDLVYLNKGKDGAIEPGQIFWVLEFNDQLPEYGPIAIGRGQVRVLHVTEDRSVAVIEKSCDRIRIGERLVPFEAKEGMMGKDLGYDVPPVEVDGIKGHLVYLQSHLNQIGSHMQTLIDIGEDQGLQVGQQLILYRKIRPGLPITILGSCVVIDVKSRTSTVKVLSCKDAIVPTDLIMERPL